MPVYNTTVQSVQQRVVNTKGGRSSTVYEILTTDGQKWATFRQPIANEANRLVGMTVEITGRIEQKGQYQNHYIDDIRATNGNTQHTPEIPFVEQARQAQQQRGYTPQPAQPQNVGAGWDEKDWCIMRQTAAKVSAWVSNNDPIAFWQNLEPIVTYMAFGLIPQEYQGNALPPERRENRYIPSGAYSEPIGTQVDDDIPF